MKYENMPKNPKKLTKIYAADFEAFPDSKRNANYNIYAAGIINLGKYFDKTTDDDGIRIFYGRNAAKDYLSYCDKLSGILWYFNGSGFDNFLHLQAMFDNNYPMPNDGLIKHGSRIIAFRHSDSLKVRDLYLFIQSSLEDACFNWKVPQDEAKTDFKHEKIYDWESAEKNRDELEEYLRHDLTALASLYKIYSKTMFDSFEVDITQAVTPTKYAVYAWMKTQYKQVIENIYIPHAGYEEDVFRASYVGGRVQPQRLEFKSKDYNDIMDGKIQDWASIQDYLICCDVNSLYPFAQWKFLYAYGKWIIHDCNYVICDGEEALNDFENRRLKPEFVRKRANLYRFLPMINKANDVNTINRCLFEVDVTCPKDLITAYLYERDAETKEVRYTLHDKKKQWYWGCEIIEAKLLGYAFTHIYTVVEFEKYGDLFSKYVDKCWKNRVANPKPSIINLANKQAMTRLTGKFGQLTPKTFTYFLRGSSNIPIDEVKNINSKDTPKTDKMKKEKFQFTQKMIDQIEDFNILFSADGKNSVIAMDLIMENLNPTYSIPLSAQILARSRAYMSSILRGCNGYLNRENSFYYTDTDSFYIHANSIPSLRSFLGNDLGQMSCDIDSGFSKHSSFAKIVRGIWSAPKGPYSVVFMKYHNVLEKGKLMEKIRLKGIPHTDEAVPHVNKCFEITSKTDLTEIEWLMNRVYLYFAPKEDGIELEPITDMIKKRYYCVIETLSKEDSEREGVSEIKMFTQFINFDLIRKIVYYPSRIRVFVFFGSMKKEWCPRNNNSSEKIATVTPQVIQRQIGKNNWWAKDLRFFYEHEGKILGDNNLYNYRYALSYPPGYVRTEEDDRRDPQLQTNNSRREINYKYFLGTDIKIF